MLIMQILIILSSGATSITLKLLVATAGITGDVLFIIDLVLLRYWVLFKWELVPSYVSLVIVGNLINWSGPIVILIVWFFDSFSATGIMLPRCVIVIIIAIITIIHSHKAISHIHNSLMKIILRILEYHKWSPLEAWLSCCFHLLFIPALHRFFLEFYVNK